MSPAVAALPAALLGQADPGSPLGMLPLIAVFFAIFYFMIIRPQQKQAKQTAAFLAGLQKGDDVVTTGGLIGKITQVAGKVITLEIAPTVKVRVMVTQVTGPFKAEAEVPAGAKASEAKK